MSVLAKRQLAKPTATALKCEYSTSLRTCGWSSHSDTMVYVQTLFLSSGGAAARIEA